MAAVSEEELETLRLKNEKLREDISSAQAKKSDNVMARQRELDASALTVENVRLEAELTAAKEAAKVEVSKVGTANLIDQAKVQLENAKALAGATVGPVDTNAPDQPKNTTGATVAVEGGTVTTAPDGVTTVVAAEEKKSSSSTTNKDGGN